MWDTSRVCSERRKRSRTRSLRPCCHCTSAATALLALRLPQGHSLTKGRASSVFCSCVLRSSVSSWRCESPSSPPTLFHLGSVPGGCRHTSQLAKTSAAWACTGVSDTVSSGKVRFAPGRQGVRPDQPGARGGGSTQSLREVWRPTCWRGGSALQDVDVTTNVKEEKLGQLLRLLAGLPAAPRAAVWRFKV